MKEVASEEDSDQEDQSFFQKKRPIEDKTFLGTKSVCWRKKLLQKKIVTKKTRVFFSREETHWRQDLPGNENRLLMKEVASEEDSD